MNLNLVNDLFNNLKENKFVQNFMKELSNYLENNIKNNSGFESEEVPIIEDILSKNNVTTGNANAIRFKEDDVILKYAEKNSADEPMYFVKDSKKTYWLNNKRNYNNDVYSVLKVQNGKIEEIEISKKDMPKDIGVNSVFRTQDGKYVINSLATKELQQEITNMANEILDKQNVNLDKHRKEGHLYIVTEELNNSRFLRDLTESSKVEFEEVNFPEDLLNKATTGAVFKYTNGRYEYQADNEIESTN